MTMLSDSTCLLYSFQQSMLSDLDLCPSDKYKMLCQVFFLRTFFVVVVVGKCNLHTIDCKNLKCRAWAILEWTPGRHSRSLPLLQQCGSNVPSPIRVCWASFHMFKNHLTFFCCEITLHFCTHDFFFFSAFYSSLNSLLCLI